jgi:hypothetical protein
MLPNFLHVGAAKCASTWLYKACREHPGVYVPPNHDNVNYFLTQYHRGLEWYMQTYFGNYLGESVCGEFSNGYMISDLALERIAAHLPDVRLTLTVREPVERAYINWAYEKRKRQWTPDQRVDISLAFHPNRWQFFRCWVEPSLCGAALRRILRHFGRDQVLVLFLDDLCQDPGAFLQQFFGFVGAERAFEPSIIDKQVNGDRGQEDIAHCPPGLCAELARATREDVLLLQELTGRDLSHWLDRYEA